MDHEAQTMPENLEGLEIESALDTPISRVLAAAEEGDLQTLVAVLDEHEVSINEQGEDGDTTMHIACLYGHLDIVQECLRRAAQVGATDEDGSTPLHDACAGGHYEIAKLLLENDAQVDAYDTDGDSPLHLAANGGHAHVVQLLLCHTGPERSAAILSKQNANGYTPADLAENPELMAQLRLHDGNRLQEHASVAAFKKRRA